MFMRPKSKTAKVQIAEYEEAAQGTEIPDDDRSHGVKWGLKQQARMRLPIRSFYSTQMIY